MFERCIYFNSNALVRELNRIWDETYRQAGVSAPHAYLLRIVAQQPGMSQQQIAAELHLEKSTVTRFINALIDKGHVKRQKGEDGRENKLFATRQGRQLARRLDQLGDALYQKLRKKLGARQFDALVGDMRRVLADLG